MIRAVLFAWAMLWAAAAGAQELTALARVDPLASRIEDRWWGRTDVTVQLSQGVPYRVFLLDGPSRLVVDFQEADFSGVSPSDVLATPGRVSDVRFGAYRPGWSRLVADLAEPMTPAEIGMAVDANSGRATLSMVLKPADADAFAAAVGAPHDPTWDAAFALLLAPQVDDGRFTVALDPGHGGIDPGAERGDLNEKELMLTFARSLRDALVRSGADVVLTRDADVFVPLDTRVTIAHQARADLFISLHADNLSQGGARGAIVYTLASEASDAATAQLAARHNRADIIAGADLSQVDDEVASVLLDLARQETAPRADDLAEILVAGMDAAGGPMNRKPLRRAGFSVLKSAQVPSVLIELGFLSSERDRKNLRDPVWRSVMVNAIADAVLEWRDADAARAGLVRQ